jgi:plastocyanin
MQGKQIMAAAILFLVIATLIPIFGATSGQDVTPPLIVDATTGVPVTGGNFTVQALVSDDVEVVYVRLYNLYFKIAGGITTPQTIPMNRNGTVYFASFEVPVNAITMYYTMSGNDTSNNWSITDVISRAVEDDEDPVANCSALINLDLGGTVRFNGTGSKDNVKVNNLTWHLQSDDMTINLYGEAPSYTFNVSGTYAGTLTVKDIWGNADTAAFQVKVLDTEPPVADAGLEVYVTAGFMTFLDGSASTDNENIANYTWSYIVNGNVMFVYGVSPPITFPTAGAYQVTLTVTDPTGNTDTATVIVEVLPGQTEEESGISWWIYALLIIVIVFMMFAIVIIRM